MRICKDSSKLGIPRFKDFKNLAATYRHPSLDETPQLDGHLENPYYITKYMTPSLKAEVYLRLVDKSWTFP